MRALTKVQVFAIAATLLICVLLYFVPNKPKVDKAELTEIDAKIEEAVKLVRDGKQPMQGIMMLREVLQEDSLNVKAHFQLGVFSAQSGQFEKAVMRFKKVLTLDKNDPEPYYYLGYAYKELGDKENAISNFEKYKASVNDPKVKAEVEIHINELKNN